MEDSAFGDGKNGMSKRAALVGLAALFVTSGLVWTVPQQTEATSGSFTIYPGEMWNVTLGYFEVNHLLLWYVSVSSWSPAFTDWLEKPDGTHVSLSPNRWGVIVDQAGYWMMRFSVDVDGTSSTTVDYNVEHVVPSISIASPSSGTYVTELPFNVSGSVDGWASSVRISLDNVSYTSVDVQAGVWSWQDLSEPEGQYTIYAEETIVWGSFSVKFYDSVAFTIDSTPPDLAIISPIITPSTGTYLKDLVNISWECSDIDGIATREVKIDALDWQNVATDTYIVHLEDGNHVVTVRVTDLAGNVVFGQISFVCDTVAPEVKTTEPTMNDKIGRDDVVVRWGGSDDLSGIDHYEVRISGGQWINVGAATSYKFSSLHDGWYSVDVKAVDRSGNSATSTIGFGVFTNIWSKNGPYHGYLLYVLITAVIVALLLGYAWAQHRTKPTEPPEEEEP
jgi:hypothetical protein